MHISLLVFDFKLINLSEKIPRFVSCYYPIINNFFLIFVLSFSHSLFSLGIGRRNENPAHPRPLKRDRPLYEPQYEY
jgi:hypothetical protein